MKRIITLLALLGLVGSASAFDDWFDHSNTPGDDLWSSPGNWNTGQLPNAGGATTNRVMLYPNAGAGGLSQVDITATVTGLQFVATSVEIGDSSDRKPYHNPRWQ